MVQVATLFWLQPLSVLVIVVETAQACTSDFQKFVDLEQNQTVSSYVFEPVRNHVKQLHVNKSHRGFSKGTVLCGGY